MVSASERLLRNLPNVVLRGLRMAQTESNEDLSLWDWYSETCPCGLEAGECRIHHRAREAQRPPPSSWRTWAYVAGRGAGKTAAGAHWVQDRVERGVAKNLLLIAPTAADLRDVMVTGPSGLLAIAPPHCMPIWEPSKRAVTWPTTGARAVCISAEEPDRARGHNVDTLWCDELACWQRAQATWDLALLALRAGTNPQALITTTPRHVSVLRRILGEPTTAKTTETTFANRRHLAPEFVDQITALFEGSRLGQQEIYAELLDITEGAWFSRFNVGTHVSETAEFDYRFPVHLAIDAGVSRFVAAVWFQVRSVDQYRHKVTVFADHLTEGLFSEDSAKAIKQKNDCFPNQGRLDVVRIDPASTARTGIGPAAYGEFERVFGARILARAPRHGVADCLDFVESLLCSGNLILHPRCTNLVASFQNYRRKERGGVLLNEPAENQSPWEDPLDALRYGIRDRFPEGNAPRPELKTVHARKFF
jgi:phage terminase large subunit-like protein